MANELEILTENAASDGWVDSTPGAASTGYQAQNTAIQAHSVGEDKTYVYVSGSSVVVATGGLVDIDGSPFKITSDVTLTPASAGTWYIRVVPGADSLQKSLELTSDPGTWNAVKNGLYDGDGRRVLNWVVERYAGKTSASMISFNPVMSGAMFANGATINRSLFALMPSDYILQSQDASSLSIGNIADLAFDSNGNVICTYIDKVYRYSGIFGSEIDNFMTTGLSLRATAFDFSTGNVVAIDGYDTVLVFDGFSSSVLTSFSAPSTGCDGVAIDPNTGNMITSDVSLANIYIHDGISSSILSNFSAPGAAPRGLAINTTTGDLIIVDDTGETIYFQIGITSGIAQQIDFPSSGGYPSGVAFNHVNGKMLSHEYNTQTSFVHAPIVVSI